jgi:hypothetical protein
VIVFEIALPTLICVHCHCTMCRQAHGAGYVTWVGASREGFRIVKGDEHLNAHRSSDHGTRSFCGRCGSSLFFESTHRPEMVDVVLANLEGPIDREPELHVYFSDRAKWVRVDDGLPRRGGRSGFEPIEE